MSKSRRSTLNVHRKILSEFHFLFSKVNVIYSLLKAFLTIEVILNGETSMKNTIRLFCFLYLNFVILNAC
jgi:hypothetical protein